MTLPKGNVTNVQVHNLTNNVTGKYTSKTIFSIQRELRIFYHGHFMTLNRTLHLLVSKFRLQHICNICLPELFKRRYMSKVQRLIRTEDVVFVISHKHC